MLMIGSLFLMFVTDARLALMTLSVELATIFLLFFGSQRNKQGGGAMRNPPKSNRLKAADIRAALGRGVLQPGRIENAGKPCKALLRVTLFLRPCAYTLTVVLFFVLAYILLSLLKPYLIGRAIDDFIWLKARISQDAQHRFRRDLFGHLQKLPSSSSTVTRPES